MCSESTIGDPISDPLSLTNGETMVIRANITNASTVLKNETASWDLQGSSFEIAKEDLIHPYNITVSGVPKMLNLIGTPPTPDNLTLFVTPQSVAPGETVSATATLTNRTTGTKFSGWDVEIRITGDGTETLPAKTCTAVSYTLHAAGSYTFTANNSSLSLDNSPITLIVNATVPPVPPSPSSSGGDGYSTTTSGTVSGTGRATFGTATGITGVSFAAGTTRTIILGSNPTGVTPLPDSYAFYDLTGPSFEGYA
ncbi:MAG: hypothetical protein MJ014_01865 [Methanocorpusculum sp.]|nr:hypothetical protein [Methanocorpusculum sp.]